LKTQTRSPSSSLDRKPKPDLPLLHLLKRPKPNFLLPYIERSKPDAVLRHNGVYSKPAPTQPYQRRKEWRFARRGNELLKVVAGERGRKNRKGLSRQLVIVKLMRK